MSDTEAVSACGRKPRRRKLAILLITELVTQWINVTFFLVPNINLLAHSCEIWSILVRKHISFAFINALLSSDVACLNLSYESRQASVLSHSLTSFSN